jgi:serine/threonine protein kinase/WD40 repeat protein
VAILNAALELPPEERAAYLDKACAGDADLRRRVEELLQAHEQAKDFLEAPAAGLDRGISQRISVPLAEKPGEKIDHYKLLQQIGEGGCGVVYMAEQEEPVRRRVALKIIKLGMDTKSVIARFEAERQALALMDHPNIARVFDAGATATGRPYFVMELVRGVKITDFCDENKVPNQDRLGLFTQVCQAIQHAHQKGIIHRDIKPSNILVTINDDVPVPKVIDFGIAKATQGRLTDQTPFTAFEQFLGTPAYMSPEQAIMTSLDIDTRSDIYSLGVLLYELLTGKTPFEQKELLAAGLDEMRRTIREREPIKPSTRLLVLGQEELTATANRRQTEPPKLIHTVRGDLDWVVMKCLEKDRNRRYETANGLARDLQRHLNNEPVLARPPSRLDFVRKLVQRNKMLFGAGAVVIATLVFALIIAILAIVRIQRDNRQIRSARDDATDKLRASYLAEAQMLRTSRQPGDRFASLNAVSNAVAIRRDLAARNEAIASLALSYLRVAKETIFKGQVPYYDWVCYDPGLEKYVVAQTQGDLTIRSVSDDRKIGVLPAPGFSVVRIHRFSPDSRYLRVTYTDAGSKYSDWFWDVAKRKAVLKELPCGTPTDLDGDCSFSGDSRLLARCNTNGTVSIYDLGAGKELKRLAGTRRFNVLAMNPANTQLACASQSESKVEIRDLESGEIILLLNCPSQVDVIAWSPDGRRLATGCFNRVYTWDARTGQKQALFEGAVSQIINLAFNHAGNLLATASFDWQVRLWDVESGRLLASHPGISWQFQFSQGDQELLGWVNLYHYGSLEVGYSRECRRLHAEREGDYGSCPEFSPDGHIVAVSTGNHVHFWDVVSGKEIGSFPLLECDTHLFLPDGRRLILADRTNGLSLRSLQRTDGPSAFAYRLGPPQPLYEGRWFTVSALSRDGRFLAVTHQLNDESLVFDLQAPTAKPVVLYPHERVTFIAISSDGRWVATSSWHNSLVKVWDATSGALQKTWQLPDRALVTFSPDGRWLATSTTEFQLWKVGSWQPQGPPIPGNPVSDRNFTAFSPDSQLMARTLEGNKIQVLETATFKRLATLEAPDSIGLRRFQFSPDGTRLAVTQVDQQLQLWDLRLIRQKLAQMGLDWDLPPYPPVTNPEAETPASLEVESDNPSAKN